MTTIEGVCEICGMGMHEDAEGRMACDGCDMPTQLCKCEAGGGGSQPESVTST